MSEQLTKELTTFKQDHVWIKNNFESLLDKYSDQWVAVKNGIVLDSNSNLWALRDRLADPAHTCIEFITQEPLEMVLFYYQSNLVFFCKKF